jgi:serine/threonine-protein kinase
MIAGQPPHTGPSAQSILVRILTEEPRPLTELRRTAPTHVGAAVSKAIEKLPADRFESAVAFREALLDESFRYSPAQRTGPQPGVAPPGTTTARSTSPRPRPWLVPALAVSTVLFAGLSAWGWLGGLGSVASEGPSRLTLDLGVDDPSERAEVTISPDGRTYVVELRDGTGSPLYVRHAHEPDFRALSGTEGARVPAFSPDGLWVAYDHPDDGLMRVAVAGGAPLSVGVDAVDNRRLKWVHWGRAGEIVIGRERVAGTGGVPRTWTETNLLLAVHFLPDGEAILAQTGFDGPITLFDLVSDTSYEVVREGTNPTYIETGHILYTHFDGGLFAVPFDLNAKATTGDPVPVLDGVEGDSYSVSATGTLAHRIGGPTSFFARPDQRLLLVDGTGATDTIRIPPRDMGGPRISPDGRRLAFASDGQIFTYDLERRSGPTQVTFGGENHNPVWSPDGSRIAYEARDGSLPRGRSGAGDQTPDIHVKSVDGIGEPSVLLDLAGRLVPTDWSGAALAFYEQGDGQGSIDPDLWFIDPDAGTEPSDYLSTESWESHMDISPDGAWATYQSEETGRREVYIRAFPSGLGQQRVTVEGGTTPRWSPDGQSIYYIGGSFPNQTIYVSEVQLEPSFLVLSTEVVFSGTVRGFDPHPDGRRVLVAESLPAEATPEEAEEPERVRWVVVTNWFEEMLERMGEGGR